MKKKACIIPVIVTLVLVLMIMVGVMTAMRRSWGITIGRYLRSDNGTSMMIRDNSPIQMSNRTERELFNGMENGDKIWVLHDGIAESYPGKTGVYAVIRLEKGSITDISQGVLDSLRELGWLSQAEPFTEKDGNGSEENEVCLDPSQFDTSVSYVLWIDDPAFRNLALNTREESPATSDMETRERLWSRKLPLFKFDTLEELEQFRQHDTVRERSSFSYGEMPSFDVSCAKFDEAFFKDHTLLLVYIGEGSGSYRFGVKNISCDGESLCIKLHHLNHPGLRTCDMAGWFITVAVPNLLVSNISTFDAEFSCDCP